MVTLHKLWTEEAYGQKKLFELKVHSMAVVLCLYRNMLVCINRQERKQLDFFKSFLERYGKALAQEYSETVKKYCNEHNEFEGALFLAHEDPQKSVSNLYLVPRHSFIVLLSYLFSRSF